MVTEEAQKYTPDKNAFYRDNYHYFLYGLSVVLVLVLIAVFVTYHLLNTRPLPVFYAKQADGKTMRLTSTTEPNLLPSTIIRFASKAAVGAYTFRFNSAMEQISQVRPFFTKTGWDAFQLSAQSLVKYVVENRLMVSGVVVGTPVISNQGELPGLGYVWRIQIPFLVSFQTENRVSKRRYMISISIVRVPTSINPQGIGIEQFVTM